MLYTMDELDADIKAALCKAREAGCAYISMTVAHNPAVGEHGEMYSGSVSNMPVVGTDVAMTMHAHLVISWKRRLAKFLEAAHKDTGMPMEDIALGMQQIVERWPEEMKNNKTVRGQEIDITGAPKRGA